MQESRVEQQQQQQQQQYKLKSTWREFVRALKSPSPFNSFDWIIRLTRSALADLILCGGCSRICNRKVLLPIIPIIAITLIVLVVVSYFASLRYVIQDRWCSSSCTEATNSDGQEEEEEEVEDTVACMKWAGRCCWITLHDATVTYFVIMILFHYWNATFKSPGVALSEETPNQWTSADSQGGFLGFNPTLDETAERKRVALYGCNLKINMESDASAAKDTKSTADFTDKDLYPSLDITRCEKCNILRPPRCHHCSKCNRCVLQFDHHCVWQNNCIGYNNYRSFFLMLLFLMLGCWYGVAVLFWPFYEPLREQVRQHGYKWLYSNGTGFLDLPPPIKILRLLMAGELPTKAVIDMVYPLLLGVGVLMSGFVGFHVKYVLTAVTTLEHRVILQHKYATLFRSMGGSSPSTVSPTTRNPFDQGWYRNMVQVFGPQLLLIFLPVSLTTPPPYMPDASVNIRPKTS